MFFLKKVISFWLMPLPLCLALLVAGLWLTRSPRRARLGRSLLWIAVALLLVFSNKAVSTWLLRPLESVYPPVPEFVAGEPLPGDLAACRYVVVLGGGHGDASGFSAVNKLSVSSRARLMEALRVLRALPEAKLIVSGPGAPGYPSHAAVQAQAAVSLGTDRARIALIETARDTEDESSEIRRLVGDAPFALVTSAWHMPRAMALMHSAGLHPVPCPADYWTRPADKWQWTDDTWDIDSLGRSTWALKERLGYAWIWLRGKG